MGFDTDLLKLLSAIVVAIFLAIPYLKKEYLPVIMSLKKRKMIRKKKKKVLSDKGGAK